MDEPHWTLQALAICAALWLLSGSVKNMQIVVCLRKAECMMDGPKHVLAAARWIMGASGQVDSKLLNKIS